MKVRQAELRPYNLPLRQGWRSAAGSLHTRQGWWLRLSSDDGRHGFGDCAPLPEAGSETAEAALAALRHWLPRLLGAESFSTRQLGEECPPAARCALETAMLDLQAQAAGLPLARWLEKGAAESVEVNDAGGALGSFTPAPDAGPIIKLKLGVEPLEEELAALQRLAGTLPDGTRLRLDANRAWNLAQARHFIGAAAGLPIESLEEPLADPSLARLAELQGSAPWPLAVDESLRELGTERLLAEQPVRRLVLKPMVLGGLTPALALGRAAHRAGLECVVTTTVDSAIGTWAAVHLAATLPGSAVHGLATSAWLADDLAPPPEIIDGRIRVPTVAGLGTTPYDRSYAVPPVTVYA